VERFFEFALRVLARNRQVAPSVLDDAWKMISGLAERQYGAFVFLYVVTLR
jgi:hypothetical protein